MEKLAERKRSKNCKLSAEKDIGAENYVRRANFLEKLINCAINASRHPTFSLTPRNCDDDCAGNEEGFRDECEMTDVARSLDISISAEKLLFDAHITLIFFLRLHCIAAKRSIDHVCPLSF